MRFAATILLLQLQIWGQLCSSTCHFYSLKLQKAVGFCCCIANFVAAKLPPGFAAAKRKLLPQCTRWPLQACPWSCKNALEVTKHLQLLLSNCGSGHQRCQQRFSSHRCPGYRLWSDVWSSARLETALRCSPHSLQLTHTLVPAPAYWVLWSENTPVKVIANSNSVSTIMSSMIWKKKKNTHGWSCLSHMDSLFC